MKAADAARLVAAGTGHVVEPALEPGRRADVLQLHATFHRLLQRRHDVGLAEHGALALHQPEFRLQVRWIEPDRRWRNRAVGEEFFRDQRGAAIERGEIDGIEQPRPELALEAIVRQKARAVDLVFHRRFREHARVPRS